MRNVDATGTKQRIQRINTNLELWELRVHKTPCLVADISRIYLWLDNMDKRRATKKISERKPDCKGKFDKQVHVAGRCTERFKRV